MENLFGAWIAIVETLLEKVRSRLRLRDFKDYFYFYFGTAGETCC